MQTYFYDLMDDLTALLRGREIFTCYFTGEASDFVRFNQSRVRQAGHVIQQVLTLDLIQGRHHALVELTLSGNRQTDRALLAAQVEALRSIRSQVPEDPFLHYATEVHCSERLYPSLLPPGTEMAEMVLAAGKGRDLVGILASGAIYAGFANSLGQRNWYTRHSFNLDWSLYRRADKAVKARYAGFAWDDQTFTRRMEMATAHLGILDRPARTLTPGRYRVYLSPMALDEILDLLGWGGFGLRAHRIRTTPLLHMTEEGVCLNESVTVLENTAQGIAPDFQEAGFMRPPQVTLIERGVYRDYLVSPRSAAEYNVSGNGANDAETPLSLEMAPGTLALQDVLKELDNGLYISNLWYLNYSDRNAARLTGMTRFATFWVNNARLEAPISVMRFDDTLYHILGDRLLGLTAEREMLLDCTSYGGRSTRSAHLPGALVEGLSFTL
jgi:predicted Zn-dependent protease